MKTFVFPLHFVFVPQLSYRVECRLRGLAPLGEHVNKGGLFTQMVA